MRPAPSWAAANRPRRSSSSSSESGPFQAIRLPPIAASGSASSSEHRQRRAGTGGDEAVALAVIRRPAKHLGPLGHDGHRAQPQIRGETTQDIGLLPHRVDERPAHVGARQRERDAWQATARAKVERRACAGGIEQLRSRQRVEQVQAGDLAGLGDARQVQALVGGEQQRGVGLGCARRSPSGRRVAIAGAPSSSCSSQRRTSRAAAAAPSVWDKKRKCLLRWRFSLPGRVRSGWPAFASAPRAPGYRTRPPGKQDLDLSSR